MVPYFRNLEGTLPMRDTKHYFADSGYHDYRRYCRERFAMASKLN